LVARYLSARRGEDAAALIGELFGRHYEKVVTWCLRMTGNRDDACDVAQGIFVRAQRNLASFRGESKFTTWLYAIVRSECMTFLGSRAAREEAALDDGAHPLQEQAARRVRELLDWELDDVEKLVFTLHYGEEVPLTAITRLLFLENHGGAKAFIVSARRKLARAIARLRATELRLDA
jgi:RNA polymerase sigma-70 factor (ECF subfamily)